MPSKYMLAFPPRESVISSFALGLEPFIPIMMLLRLEKSRVSIAGVEPLSYEKPAPAHPAVEVLYVSVKPRPVFTAVAVAPSGATVATPGVSRPV